MQWTRRCAGGRRHAERHDGPDVEAGAAAQRRRRLGIGDDGEPRHEQRRHLQINVVKRGQDTAAAAIGDVRAVRGGDEPGGARELRNQGERPEREIAEVNDIVPARVPCEVRRGSQTEEEKSGRRRGAAVRSARQRAHGERGLAA